MKRANYTLRAATVFAASGLATTPTALGQNIFTGGAGGGDWHNSQNWSLGVTPQPTHDVVIPQGIPGVSSSGAFVNKLTSQSPLSVGGGGTTVVQDASLTDFTTTGGFVCSGAVSFTGNVSVQTSYTWRAAGGFTNAGAMNVTAVPLSLCTLTNQGTINVSGGPLAVGATVPGLVNNGTLELRSGGHLFNTGQFVNNATWRKVGASDSEVQCNVAHSGGTLSVEGGLLRLTGGGFYNAPMTIELGGRVRLEGPFVNLGHFFDTGASITGAGELEVQCGGSNAVQILEHLTVNLQGDDGLHMQSGGVQIAEDKRLVNNGKLRWEGGSFEGPGELSISGGTLVIPAGRSVPAHDGVVISNAGTATIDGVLTLNDDSVFRNTSGGITILRGEFRPLPPSSGTVVIRNIFRTDPGSGNTAKIQPVIEHISGELSVDSGTLLLQGGGSIGGVQSTVMKTTQPGTLLGLDFGTYYVAGADHHLNASTSSNIRIRGAGTMVNVQPGMALKLEGTGSIFLESNAQLGGPGQITNSANFIWNSQIGVNGQANFANSLGVFPFGSVLIPPGGARLRGTFNNQIAAIVLQQGTLDMSASTVRSDGRWILQPASTAQIAITGAGGTFYNLFASYVSAEAPPNAGRSAVISTRFSNDGTVQAIGGITLTFNGQVDQLQNGVLTGGEWRTAEGGRIILPSVPPITTIKGAAVVGSQQGLPWLAGVRRVEGTRLYAEGDILFTGPLDLDDDELFAPSIVRIAPDTTVTVPGSTTVGQPGQPLLSSVETRSILSLQPAPGRLITPVMVTHGVIRPGGPDASGAFNLTGQLSMRDNGVLEVDIGGLAPESEHDQMAITGGASLTGTLAIKLLPGFAPAPNQSFTIMTSTAPITGGFASIQQPAGAVQFQVQYSPNAVTLSTVPGCYANCDQSAAAPVLNANDFVCFLNRYVAGDDYANCDGSSGTPPLTANDFVCFLSQYAIGCD
jgi:hypothetical protein